jgi:hypothetical protein
VIGDIWDLHGRVFEGIDLDGANMIGSAINSSLAGIASATRRINASAESIAASGEDVSATTPAKTSSASSSSPLADPASLSGVQSVGDAGPIVDLMQASLSYRANVAVLKVENRVEKSVIDILG